RVEDFDGCPLAIVRRRATLAQLSSVIPEACGTVWNVIRAQHVAGAGRHVAVYLDDAINLEVGVELAAPFAGHREVIASALPAGSVATTIYFGPYQQLAAAHDAIHQWGRDNGITFVRPCWEVYGHWKDEWNRDPSKIQTDVFYLIGP